MDIKVSVLSESAMSVFIGKEISVLVNQKLNDARTYILSHSFIGLEEVVLSYHSITVFYDPLLVFNQVKSSPSLFVKNYLLALPWAQFKGKLKNHNDVEIEIPVKYGGEDLEILSQILNLSTKEIVEIHSAKSYQVFMIGFLPGFPYLGILDERLKVKRKNTPNPLIEKGSVAIANLQTGIYPIDSPGGWYVLGKTNIEMFDLNRKQKSYLKAGDNIIFKAI